MPVQATICRPVSEASFCRTETSRPSIIAVGSTTVFTPWDLTASADSSARDHSCSRSRTCGHCAVTASSPEKKCSWISVRPSSSASIGPLTPSTLAIAAPLLACPRVARSYSRA